MEGTNNNNCISPDLWMSHIDPQFPVSHSNPSVGDTRTMSSVTAHLDLSRKQTTLYNNYDVPSTHYKQSIQAMTTSAMQPFATSSTRSAWGFATDNFSPTPKDFSSQSFSQPMSNATPRFSQPISSSSRFPQSVSNVTQQNMSQQSARNFTSHNVSQPSRNFPLTSASHLEDSIAQTLPQTLRDMTPQNLSQSGATDRSVWDLYSLNPSISPYSMSSHVSQNTNYMQEKPYMYKASHSGGTTSSGTDQPGINRGSLSSQKPTLILGMMKPNEQVGTSYSSSSSLPSDIAPSMFSSLPGASNTTKQGPSVSYEDEIGGYSPVSPPTQDSPQFLASASSHNADLKNDDFTSSNTVSDLSLHGNPPFPVHQSMHCNPSYSDSSLLSMPLDVPLDMTKVWPSPTDVQLNQPVVQNVNSNISSSVDITKQSRVSNQFSDVSTVNQPANCSLKVAPKKSNFYGRDASYFSVPEESPNPSQQSDRDTRNIELPSNDRNGEKESELDAITLKQNIPALDVPQEDRNYAVENVPTTTMQSALLSNVHSNSQDANVTDLSTQHLESEIASSGDAVPDETKNSQGSVEDTKTFDIPQETIDSDEEDLSLSKVRAKLQQNSNDGVSQDCSDKEETDESINKSVENEAVDNLELPPVILSITPTAVVISGRGRAPKGRKRKRAPRKKPRGKALTVMPGRLDSSFEPGNGDTTMNPAGDELNHAGIEAGVPLSTPVAPKGAKGRKRKAKAADIGNPDSEEPVPSRRSSNRRSKDNAMRLIGLQAESIFSHSTKSEAPEPHQPARPRRRAAQAVVPSTIDENVQEVEDVLGEKDVSSDEMSDEKDIDYAVNEDDVEDLEKDQLLDTKVEKKKTMLDTNVEKKKTVIEKRGGGLKISIKLGGLNSSAEILSGIEEPPPNKKRKVVKKKGVKTKFKSKAIIQDDDDDDDKDNDKQIEEMKMESEISESKSDEKIEDKDVKSQPEEKTDIVVKHNSLMDKYFSSASSAAVARPVEKPGNLKNKNKNKKQSSAKATSKNLKGISKVNSNTASSTPSNSEGDTAASAESNGVPKFVCGYCPNRYHSKQALLSHMEDHMAEMEDKPDKIQGTTVAFKEVKKLPSSTKETDLGSVKPNVLKFVKKNEGTEESRFNCGECGKTFSSKSELLDHVRTHTSEKPFECDLCHKCFKERDQLSTHRKGHVQEGLMRCPVCSKGFVNVADLNAHMESHPKRSKSGSSKLPMKSLVSDSLKKTPVSDFLKKTPVSDSLKKTPVSDSLKKSVKLKDSRDRDAVFSKPKSFASALEPNYEKNKEYPVILLKRKDATPAPSKDEHSKAVKLPKPAKEEQSKKIVPVVRLEDVNAKKEIKEFKEIKKDSKDVKKEIKDLKEVKKDAKECKDIKKELKDTKKEIKDVKKEKELHNLKKMKSVDQKPKVSNEKVIPDLIKKEDKDSSRVCTCQECPECVTRFLQSFE